MQELAPVNAYRTQEGRWIFDLGQNFAGKVRLTAYGPAGSEIVLRYCEDLTGDGQHVEQKHISGFVRTGEFQTDKYIKKSDGPEEWTPQFVYHGFRYVEAEGLPEELPGPCIMGLVMHTSFERTGHFECSDDTLMTIQRLCHWSSISNCQGVPTDCPHREKNAWTGDAGTVHDQLLLNYDAFLFLEKWLDDLCQSQRPNGSIPCVCPSTGWGYNWGNGPLARRNLVLSRMEDAGALTRKVRDSISALPIVLNYKPVSHNEGTATYFREMLRLVMNAERPKRNQFYTEWDYDQAVKEYEENPLYGWCRKNRKADGTPYNIYRDGLKIYTTVNSTMQKYAEQAVQKQMQSVIQPRMDAQYRNTKTLFIDATREERERIMRHAIRYSDRYREMEDAGASAKQIMAAFDKPCSMKVFTYRGERDTLMTPRDSILHHKRIMRASFVALDPRTGYVKAYVGGPNFRYFKYDMAKQGKRQIGSTIKPFVYTFAIDHLGLTPCTMVPNLPVTIETANGTAWSPKEAGKVEYDGVMHPLRWGLARSRNNYSAWIMKQAKQPAAVADFIHNMGIRSFIDPVPALCLGSSESNVFELVSAFSTFANEGVHTDPIFVTRIEDRQGNVIANFIPQSQDAVSERTAYTMLTMLQDVVNSGTAGRLKWQFGLNDMEIGGKTGTSNKNRDAWFMCVAPKLVAGAWVGGEDQAVHFVAGGEGSVMALPIVGDFMKRVYDDGRLGVSRADQFIRPAMMPRYDCDEEVDPDERPTEPGIAEDDNFFD